MYRVNCPSNGAQVSNVIVYAVVVPLAIAPDSERKICVPRLQPEWLLFHALPRPRKCKECRVVRSDIGAGLHMGVVVYRQDGVRSDLQQTCNYDERTGRKTKIRKDHRKRCKVRYLPLVLERISGFEV